MNKIFKVNGDNTYKYYRAGCDCGSNDHDHDIFIEVETDEPNHVIVSIYSNLEYCDYTTERAENFFHRIWSRMKAAAKVIFTGRIEVSNSFYFSSSEQAEDYARCIVEGIDSLKKK